MSSMGVIEIYAIQYTYSMNIYCKMNDRTNIFQVSMGEIYVVLSRHIYIYMNILHVHTYIHLYALFQELNLERSQCALAIFFNRSNI